MLWPTTCSLIPRTKLWQSDHVASPLAPLHPDTPRRTKETWTSVAVCHPTYEITNTFIQMLIVTSLSVPKASTESTFPLGGNIDRKWCRHQRPIFRFLLPVLYRFHGGQCRHFCGGHHSGVDQYFHGGQECRHTQPTQFRWGHPQPNQLRWGHSSPFRHYGYSIMWMSVWIWNARIFGSINI